MSTTHLMYHDIYIGTDKSSGFQSPVSKTYKVDKDSFEQQVKSCIGKDVIFTFDDGGTSFLTIAAPILEKYGFKGLFFISTKYIGSPGFLTEEQLCELYARGHFIGSHTHSHPKNLSSLTENEIEEEWTKSKIILETILNNKVTIASIPNGRGSKKVYETAFKAGYHILYTSEPTNTKRNDSGVTLIGRYVIRDISSNQTVLNIINHAITRFILHTRWRVLDTAQNIMGGYYYKLRTIMAK